MAPAPLAPRGMAVPPSALAAPPGVVPPEVGEMVAIPPPVRTTQPATHPATAPAPSSKPATSSAPAWEAFSTEETKKIQDGINKKYNLTVWRIAQQNGFKLQEVPIYIQVTAEGKIAKAHVNLAGEENAKLVAELKKEIMTWAIDKPSRAGSCNIVIRIPKIELPTHEFEMAPAPFERQ
jgi:hypothetical protein